MDDGQGSTDAQVRSTGGYGAYRDLPRLPTKSGIYCHYRRPHNSVRGLRLRDFFLMWVSHLRQTLERTQPSQEGKVGDVSPRLVTTKK